MHLQPWLTYRKVCLIFGFTLFRFHGFVTTYKFKNLYIKNVSTATVSTPVSRKTVDIGKKKYNGK